MTYNMTNRTVLVTGGTRGIGEKIVELFLENGATVIGTGASEESTDKMSFRNRSYPKFKAYTLNLKDAESTLNFCEQLKKDGYKIDTFISNAAINQDALAIHIKASDWVNLMNINVQNSTLIGQYCLKDMIRMKFGRMIFISSIVAFTGNKGQSAYCATKGAIVSYAKALALEVASRNITVNCIAPGFIESDMTGKLTQEQKDTIFEKIPMQKLGSPLDIAHGCLFLASAESSYITGQTLHINGGLY